VTSLQLVIQSLHRGIQESVPSVPVQMLAIAEQQSRRLRALIDQLLDVSRIQAGRLTLELEDVDLAAEARRVIAQLEPEIHQSRAPVHLRADRPVVGLWDRSRIEQLITNLLTNALKYGAGEPIDVAVERAREGLARLTVRDRGIGIAPDRLPHIFERFERAGAGRHYGGLGLGLFIVHEIVTAHGGAVTVDSELGRGSAFMVELPMTGAAAPHSSEEERAA
jgi:signal transduction histidine kinase